MVCGVFPRFVEGRICIPQQRFRILTVDRKDGNARSERDTELLALEGDRRGDRVLKGAFQQVEELRRLSDSFHKTREAVGCDACYMIRVGPDTLPARSN